jgi:hypothetical protein
MPPARPPAAAPQATKNFTQVLNIYGHTHGTWPNSIHIESLLVWDIAADRAAAYLVRPGEEAYVSPSRLASFTAVAGRRYHVVVANLKTVYVANGHVKYFANLLWGGGAKPLHADSVVVVDATRARLP